MKTATLTGMRNIWALAIQLNEVRLMSAREMALTSWGKVHQHVNVAPDGTRWTWSSRYNAFASY